MLKLDIKPKDGVYSVYIKKGLIQGLGDILKGVIPAKKVAIITDTHVHGLYGERFAKMLNSSGFDTSLAVVEAGEQSKSIETLVDLYKMLLAANICRHDCIVTLGGGVVGDLGGFAAATLFRGIPYFQVPTSLLAQVDSSIGGKVAVDLPEGKNLVGNFYHPKGVFIDPDVLDTLEPKFFSDGMAEVIKYSLIKDKSFFDRLMEVRNKKELLANIMEIIKNCLEIKKDVVEKDEKDMGGRMILNFGHTFGHAVEKYYNYEKYTHGEAVAIGMYQISKNSETVGETKPGTCNKIKEILQKYDLPFGIPQDEASNIIKAITFDKKSCGNALDIILLKSIGECFIKRINKDEIPHYFL